MSYTKQTAPQRKIGRPWGLPTMLYGRDLTTSQAPTCNVPATQLRPPP